MPVKRFDRVAVSYLPQEEVAAVIDGPDRGSWSGRRDAVMLATMYNTAAQVSEIIRLNVGDLKFGPTATVRIHGKGAKNTSFRCGKKHGGNWQTGFARSPRRVATLYFQVAEASG
jgi:site-specific recombinase XerD